MNLRILLSVLLATACGGDDEIIPPGQGGGDPPDAAPAGPVLHAVANAEATGAGDERVVCTVWVDISDLETDGDGWTGVAAGEVFRQSFDGDAPLFEFQALLGGEVSLTSTGGDAVEVRLVGDQPDDAKPFWLELEVLAGTASGELTYDGSWTCAPILPGDPDTEDLEIDAPGTWSIAPA